MTHLKSWKTLLGRSVALAALTALSFTPAHTVVPNDNTDSEEIVDEDGGVNGVGMFFSGGGVCSGTLINPRTVIFAAHCVNFNPATDYGTSQPAAWSLTTAASTRISGRRCSSRDLGHASCRHPDLGYVIFRPASSGLYRPRVRHRLSR